MSERDGDPREVGICLSGGGLRAAAFSLGVLQVLQERLGLLYGSRAAGLLAAVSGGSYTAGAYVLNGRCRDLDGSRYAASDPLSAGSCEEDHILGHADYLAHGRIRFAALIVLNLAALAVLFAWTGMMIADVGAIRSALPDDLEAEVGRVDDLPIALLTGALVASIGVLVRGLYAESPVARIVWVLPGLAVLLATANPVLEWASGIEWLSDGTNVLGVSAVLFVGLLAALGAAQLAKRRGVRGIGASAINLAPALVVRLFGVVLLGYVAVLWFPEFAPVFASDTVTGDEGMLLGLFALTLVGGVAFSYVPHRASLHREYRRRIHSCFGVVRGPDGASSLAADDVPLSRCEGAFPRLLVCATANVRARHADGTRTNFVPFVMAPDRCSVTGHETAWFETAKLELGREPAGVTTRRKEPLISLFTAIATTGAAVSPSMGRFTVPSARPLLAALNIRLGRWLPNPFSARALRAVAKRTTPGRFDRDQRLGRGYDELVPEMLGLDGPRTYVSDGGHYDNLGLLTLLRAGCRQIWCVDSSPDPAGAAAELDRVLEIARDRFGIPVDLELAPFAAGPDGLYETTHAIGTLRTGRLVVIKLGLVADSGPGLRERVETDPGFPHHATKHQVYPRDRMEAYRDAGREAAARCLDELGVPAPS